MDFDDISIIGLIGGAVGAMVSMLVAKSMAGDIFIRIATALVTGVVCYFLVAKVVDD